MTMRYSLITIAHNQLLQSVHSLTFIVSLACFTIQCVDCFIRVYSLQETEVVIRDVQVKGGYIIHMGTVEGTIRVGDKLNLLVDTVSI